ncbi:MAG: bifunctional 3-(3-hydroxy-phenyl)propionate/3-hydroxycinnamic acid hydroxylase [Pseudomonadota bacterium]
MTEIDVDVAVVGAGPVGLTLACLLAQRGVAVHVLERRDAPYPLPRAVHLDGEAMRVLQASGVADAVCATCRVGVGMQFRAPDGTTVVDWSRAPDPGPEGWHESYRCHQPDIEAILRDRAAALGVDVAWGTEATALKTGADAVTLTTQGPKGVAPLAARWAVGCDGAGSFLRRAAGIVLEDLGFSEDWLVADLILTRPRPDLGDHSIQFCDPERPATYVRSTGDRRRWEIRLSPGEPAPTEAMLWKRLAPLITPRDAVLERMAVYTFRSALARDWRKHRVFLAGDAAHQMPPFMGQGLCCGLRDAANLGWKLARRVAGQGAPGLLDTYGTERAPQTGEFIAMATRLGRLINQTATTGVAPGPMRWVTPPLGPGLQGNAGHPVLGNRAPQVWVRDRRADDVAGADSYVLARTPQENELPVVVDPTDWLVSRGLQGIEVRPDGYIRAAW